MVKIVMESIQEDIGEGNLQCTNHTYKNTTTPGGICVFCLQEKLGNLVSSCTIASTLSIQANNINSTNNYNYHHFDTMRKPRNLRSVGEVQDYSYKKKGFWSFLYYSSSKHSSTAKKTEKSSVLSSLNGSIRPRKNKKEEFIVYSRSRSVGCESKVSTVLDGCTLRRVESQRERKHIVSSSSSEENENGKFTVKGKSWGWILASPMRVFSKSSLRKKRQVLKKNV